MGDQPGAGGSYSYKIKGHSRQRRSAKPYSRPSDRKKGVLESVKDFFSPSWLLDFWKGKTIVNDDDVGDSESDEEGEETLQTTDAHRGATRRLSHEGLTGTSNDILGNGGLGIVASAQKRSGTFPKSGLSSLLSIRSRTSTSGASETLETKTTGFASSVSETTKSSHDYSQTPTTDSPATVLTETLPGSRVPLISTSSSQSDCRSSLFGLKPSSSSTPDPTLSFIGPIPGPSTSTSQEAETPGPSLLSGRPQLRSVFRSRPEFSVSAFGSPLPPRPSSQTGRHSSPYYSGKTVFGGAASGSTSKRARVASPSSLEGGKPIKRQIKPTPLSGPSVGGVASQTAKRILETLEKMSSPLVDAKKIPPSPPFSTSSSPLSFSQTRRRKQPQQPYNRPVGSPRKLEAQFSGPPVESFSVPQRASISRIRTDKQSSTTTTQITSTPLVTSSIGQPSSINTAKSSFVPTPLPMSLSPMETGKGSGGGGGKMRAAKTSSAHYKVALDESEEVVNPLPVITSAVPLKLPSGTNLPSFSFTKPTTHTSNKLSESAFSSSKSKPANISSNNFKFSVPEPKISTSNVSSSSKSSPQKTVKYSFSSPAPVATSEPSTSESPKDVISLDKFKPPAGSWECPDCMIFNKADVTSCTACTASKPSSKKLSLPSNDMFKAFQPPSGSWSCNSCMLSNKATDTKCIACEALKPSKKGKETISKDDNLLKKFAPPSDSWECPTCMIINKAQDVKCVACEEPKPGAKPTSDISLLNKFAPPPGSWNCDTCLINNKPEHYKCSACEAPKPGTSVSDETTATSSLLKFGSSDSSSKGDAGKTQTVFKLSVPSSVSSPFNLGQPSTSTPFVFGAPSTSNHTNSVTFGSSETATSSKPFQFGSTDTASSGKPFQFGSSETVSSSKPYQFGSTLASTSSNSTPFVFGANQDASKAGTFQFGKTAESNPSASTSETTSTFKFGSSMKSEEKQSTVQFGLSTNTDSPKPTGFNFGANKSPLKNIVTSQVEKEAPNKTTPSSQPSVKVGQTSIAQAAAAGLLKIPSSVAVVDLTSDDEPQKAVAPPNANLFADQSLSTANQILTTNTDPPKPEVSAPTALPSLPFAFGTASIPTTKPTEDLSTAKPFSFTPAVTSSTPLPSFGQTPTATSTAVSGFAFGSALGSTDKAAPTAPVPSFSGIPQQTNTLPSFAEATKDTASSLSTSPFVFKGTTDSVVKFGSTPSTANSGSGFKFGGAASSGSTGFSFGGNSQPGSSAVGSTPASFAFGGSTGETQKSGFAFGSSTQQPFAFGNTAAAQPTPPISVTPTVSEESMDADGNNNNSQQTVPAFGSSVAAQSTTPFGFSAPPGNTGFNFSSSLQQPASFKFGATDAAPPVFGATSGMGAPSAAPAFGASTGNPPQQGGNGGFNFGAPAANNSQPSAGAFTIGTGSAFTAGPATANIGGRRIKRGIRRTKR